MSGEKARPAVPTEADLDYLNLSDGMQEIRYPRAEGFKEKFYRKTKENPFVPIGLSVTTFALAYGLWQLKTGDRVMSQKMMRLRVAAQGFTVFAILGGVFYTSMKAKNVKN